MIGIGVNIRPFLNKVARAAADYYNRITADGGVSESPDCVNSGMSDLDRQNLLNNASLLLIPSGYKGGKLYSEIPTNGNGDLTWTRGSDAFRTNASGLIQRVPWNLLQYSEDFSNAAWTKTTTTVTTNSINSPNGTLTADTLTGTGNFPRLVQSATLNINTAYTMSVYAKMGTAKSFKFAVTINAIDIISPTFDLSVGTVSPTTNTSITNVGNGWYRCTATFTTPSTITTSEIRFFSNNFGVTDGWSNGNTIYGWGAQLVEGTTAQTYLPTTDRLNFPRLDYTYGSCPSALLEPQRTNLVLYSEQFDNAYWLKANVTIIANQETSPDGTQNADLLSASSGATAFLYKSFTLTTGTPYTLSIYVKKKTVTISSNRFRINFVNNLFVDFSGSVPVITGGSGSVVSSVNGFYRIITTVTPSVASNVLYIYPDGNNNSADEFYIYGAQLEAGAYPTTYIPTTSATATRVADSFSRSNIYTNGLISASGGTWFVELRNNVSYVRDSVAVNLFIGDNSSSPSNALVIRSASASATRLSIQKVIAGAFTILATPSTDTIKVAFKWNGTSADVFVNGTKEISATAFTTTNMEFLACTAPSVPFFIQQMALYPTPLSDTDCELLTGTAYSSYESMATALGYYVI